MSKPIVRRSDFVRTIGPYASITGDNAFIDRVQLEVGDWALFGSQDDICDALSCLRNVEVATTLGEVIPLFNAHLVTSFRDVGDLRFQTSPTDALNRAQPLLFGKAQLVGWRNRRTSQRPEEQARIAFDTHLNLTRFVQAQRLKRITRLDRPSLASDLVLAITPDATWYEDELPLLPATNVIIGPNKKFAYALKQPRASQLREYIALVVETLSNAMRFAFDEIPASVEHLPHFMLREVEVYWEFDSDEPIDWVNSMRWTLFAQGESVSETIYDLAASPLEVQNQSPCLTVVLTRDIRLKVYAKTNRRVRFEVKLRGNAINNCAGPRTQDSIEGVVAMIPAIANEAASRLQPILQSITEDPPPPGSFTAVQLLHVITRATDDPHVSEAIVASLVAFGRVSPYRSDPLLRPIHRLRDWGVLRTLRPRSHKYVVTDDYRDALENLRRYR